MSKQDKATNERHSKILRELVKQPDNKICADCKRHDPRWASWNLGVFVCIRCSGVHRGIGTHISKVKSVDLDVWTPEQIQSVQKWGNRRANLYWEAHLKAGHVPPDHKVDSFIRSKYEGRRWAMEGPPPDDPRILEGPEEELPPQEVINDQPLPSSTPPPKAASPGPGLNPGASRTARPLLSTSVANANANRAARANVTAPAPRPAPTPPAPPKPQDDLFSLDFHAGPASTSTPEPRKGDKNDILSLFSTGPSAAAAPAPAANAWGGSSVWGAPSTGAPAPASNDIWGSFASAQAPAQNQNNSLFGGMSSTQAQVPLSNVWGAPAAAQSFGNNVWGSSGTASTGPDLFGSSAGSTQKPTTKKDDAFGDLWS